MSEEFREVATDKALTNKLQLIIKIYLVRSECEKDIAMQPKNSFLLVNRWLWVHEDKLLYVILCCYLLVPLFLYYLTIPRIT